MVGSIVGVGIFFKSGGILKANDWNGIGTLVSWIIGGILSLAAAISFSEIGTMKVKRTTGLSAWTEKVAGKKAGYFVRFNYPFYYYGLLGGALGFFASEALFNIFACYGAFSMNDIPAYVHAIVGFVIAAGFVLLNYISIKSSGIVQQVTTILKWIPLIAVAALGILLATTNEIPGTTGNHYGHNAFTNGQSFKFTGMLAAIPAVLFAFDAFLAAPTLSKKIRGGVKKVPLVVIIGILSCLSLYLLIALSAVLHGTGYVSSTPLLGGTIDGTGIFDQLFKHNTAVIIGQLVMIFLFISTWGVLNGITATMVTTTEQAVETETIVGSRFAKNKFKHYSLWFSIATYGFWFILFLITTAITGSDAVVDGLSNFTSLFFFGIYGYVILRYTLKRSEVKVSKINNKLFYIFAWIAIIGIGFFVAYSLTYGFFINAIINPHNSSGWGLFASHGIGMELWQSSIVFFSMLILFITAPVLNYFWLTKKKKRQVLIDTFK